MKKSRYTEEQIAFALKQAELGTTVTFWAQLGGKTVDDTCKESPETLAA
ncbi:hypothetical protein [Burkholderia sp. 22PA0106]